MSTEQDSAGRVCWTGWSAGGAVLRLGRGILSWVAFYGFSGKFSVIPLRRGTTSILIIRRLYYVLFAKCLHAVPRFYRKTYPPAASLITFLGTNSNNLRQPGDHIFKENCLSSGPLALYREEEFFAGF